VDDSGRCLPCRMQQHLECNEWQYQVGECCCAIYGKESDASDNSQRTGARDGMVWSKDDSLIRDAKSTGRKRAAGIFPLDATSDCEWLSLSFAGGGLYPIFGCQDGKQQHRHHGPNLSTLDNREGNVHRICTTCHNTWHTNNDAFIKEYDDLTVWAEHDHITKYGEEELARVLLYGSAVASRDRFTWRSYKKDSDDYREYIQRKEGSSQ